MVRGKHVLILTASVTTGISVAKAMDCVEYYGGTTAGICSIFSAQDEIAGMRVHSVFTPEDIPDYATYPSHDCPPVQAEAEAGRPGQQLRLLQAVIVPQKQRGIPGKTQGCFFYGRSSSFTSKVNLDRVVRSSPSRAMFPSSWDKALRSTSK